jgi:hypothetical protein
MEDEKKYCGNCDRSFPTLLDFMQHDQAVHISCQFCDQIGSRKNRKPFDNHCCGCSEVLDGDEALDKHLQEHPQHHHAHPEFTTKSRRSGPISGPTSGPTSGPISGPPPGPTSAPRPVAQTAQPVPRRASIPTSLDTGKSRLVHLSPMSAAGIQFTRTPATPIDGLVSPSSSQASRPLSRKRRRSHRIQSKVQHRSVPERPKFLCDDCRIVFPDGPTLLRHRNFSFLRTFGCETKFTCPFSLLRHIESGTCCHWKSADQ